jgi:DNA polymerase-3 subunit epsilon
VLADLGRCPAPCVGAIDEAGYAQLVAQAREALAVDPQPVVEGVGVRMAALAAQERYEEAAAWRDRLAALLRGIDVTATSDVLGRIEHLVAARPTEAQGWEVHVIRHGRLAGAALIEPGVDPTGPLAALIAAAEHVPAPHRPATAALPEETQVLARWLFTPGVRLVDLRGEALALPHRGAGAHRATFEVDLREAVPAGMGG